ncbi:succinyldiaminopimelate transaminase [Chromobacterium phragmitis]|uniref:Putative 8-amino-7-oxononanoate synthase n=1 Tax=Chromobacterium phragmitis TaxID=2202141 RepID=A0A344UIG9_9NEIS|nr:succinyldiaminopimelate transaminase [Chromobacterium phragmitis]AXE35067.1 succinyldiaminopimelate transaminase [Chromobacterium phragmitis]
MNPRLDQLHPYPFQRLAALLAGCLPPPALPHISLAMGEPKHPAPQLVKDALCANLSGLSGYPATQGAPALRQACAGWGERRYGVALDPAREVLPVNGSREALFSLTQCLVDASGERKPVVVSPNPFYQIYEGAALLAGAEPYYLNCEASRRFQPDWDSVPDEVWARTQLLIVCSPGNPTGAVMGLADWERLFALSDRYGFVIASDECYSEIYFDEAPLGGLSAARLLGRGLERLVMLTSLSKRSNVPGMRSGFVAGDASILEKFLLYRTYHGSAMSLTVQAASIAAWNDEAHVESNRAAYAAKFAAVLPLLRPVLEVGMPDAGFYLWAKVPGGDDVAFARALFERQHVTVLPGSFLARDARGANPGRGYIRIALVAGQEECVAAAQRIVEFTQTQRAATPA